MVAPIKLTHPSLANVSVWMLLMLLKDKSRFSREDNLPNWKLSKDCILLLENERLCRLLVWSRKSFGMLSIALFEKSIFTIFSAFFNLLLVIFVSFLLLITDKFLKFLVFWSCPKSIIDKFVLTIISSWNDIIII